MTTITLHAPFAGWLTSIEEVPDAVFAERMMGDGIAIDPTEGVLRAPADGRVAALPPSGHAVTLALANGAELLLHIGLETVALGGDGFHPLVVAGAEVRCGDPLIEFDLDRVARGAKDMITPIVLTSEHTAFMPDATGRRVVAGERIGVIGGVVAPSASFSAAADVQAARRSITVTAPHGIHARPAARIIALLRQHQATVTLHHAGRRADAGSVTALLALGARHGDVLEAEAEGADAAAALAALARFAEDRFGDEPGITPPAASPATPQREGGVCASPGLAIGPVHQLRSNDLVVPDAGKGIAHESQALDQALAEVAANQSGSDVAAAIAEAHRAVLEDPALRSAALGEIEQGRSAAFGWRMATRAAADALRNTGDALLAERAADLRDLERQVIATLLGDVAPAMPALAPHTILIAEDLLPSQFLALDRGSLAGICTAAGGPTAHVAILAASAGVPMLVAAGAEVLGIADGATVVLDADAGRIVPDPSVALLAETAARIAERRERRAAEAEAARELGRLSDGTRIKVFANLGSAEDAAAAVQAGAEGCGLLRTEFLFLDRMDAPGEDEQTALYARIAAILGDRPLIVRTLDIGGDKPVPYLPREREENPALGLRGIRLGLVRRDLLQTQLRAILRGVPADQCRIMLPMIVDSGELAKVRLMVDEMARDLGLMERIHLGIMVETPAAAVLADQIAAEADFISIGTNDLTQYTLAADRGNAGVSAMVDALHPAVLRLIAGAASGAASHGRWAGVCGGLASDPLAAPLLVGLGITELSATPALVPAVKAALRRHDRASCDRLAEQALAAAGPAAVRALLAQAAA